MVSPLRLGVAGAILWGVSLFLMTVASLYTGYAALFLDVVASTYPGFAITWEGAFIGLLWGMVDGFACLFILGWLYNVLPIGR